jgi:hypothetical protein
VAPSAPTNGEIWNTGSDLQVRLGGVTETLAEQSWVTSQGYLTAASPALTGNVTITSNSANPALVITQDGAGDIVQFKDVAGDTTYTFIDANGKVNTVPAVTTGAGFNIPNGVAPTSNFVNGDFWTTTSGVFTRINGNSVQVADTASGLTYSGNNVFAGPTLTFGNTTAASTVNIGTGATLTATTKSISIGTNGVSGSTTNIAIGSTTGTNAITINGPTTLAGTLTASGATITVGNTTAASTLNLATGATLTATTKAVNIGTAGVAGSTTNIAIGSTTGTSTTTLQGTTNGVTAAADTNSVALATTAYVVGQAGSATPVVDGTAAVGTSLRYARQDHVHPTDTSRAALASPTFTGIPAAPTAAVDTNTTQLATTAYVVGQGYLKSATASSTYAPLASPSLTGTPLSTTAAADTNTTQIATTAYVVGQASATAPVINGTATIGTSLKYARADHVHPTDTTRAPLASPSLTGTPLSTTAAADTNTTQIATTAFVIGQVSTTTPANNGTAAVGTSLKYARADHVHASDTTKANLASPTFTGTPTLPTGTIATTQTAGNNTTAVATTAFVTAAVPGFATTAEIASPSSTTKVVAPNDVVRMLVNRATFDTQSSSPTFATSGAGATAYKMTNDRSLEIGTPNILTAGYGQMIYDTTATSWGALGAKRGDNFFTQDFSKKIWMSGTHCFTLLGDANTVTYCMMGGRNTVTTGQPTMQGFGWKLVGGSTALKLITYGYDGTSLVVTETASSFTPVANQTFDWMLLNEGTGAGGAGSTCKLYVNDALVASGINAPGGATVNYNYLFNSFESTVTAATRMNAIVFPIKLWWSKS